MLHKYFVLPVLLMSLASATVNAVPPARFKAELFNDLHHLTMNIGGRPTGSTALQKAQHWALARFRAAGLQRVYLSPYVAPVNWLPQFERAEIVTPHARKVADNVLRVAMMPFSANTPETGMTANVYAISALEAAEIVRHQDQIKHHWLLVPTPEMNNPEVFENENFITASIVHAAEEAGAIGILWMSSHTEHRLYRHNVSFNGTLGKLPAAVVEREDAMRLLQLLQKNKDVAVNVTLASKTELNPVNYNVVAEIKGDEKPDEVIVIGAHLDSWDLGQGALDNGCNAALVIDVARRIKKLEEEGKRPHRTIRFMLFSGEEEGLYGSWFDVKNRANQLDTIKAVIVHDLGSGRITGYSLGGRDDMLKIVDRALQPASGFGKFTQTVDAFIGTDNFDYLLHGIPTLTANQDPMPYLPHYHSNTDTFDHVDLAQLDENASIAAILTWNLATTRDVFPKRLDKQGVDILLKKTGLDEQMKIVDISYR